MHLTPCLRFGPLILLRGLLKAKKVAMLVSGAEGYVFAYEYYNTSDVGGIELSLCGLGVIIVMLSFFLHSPQAGVSPRQSIRRGIESQATYPLFGKL